MKKFLLKTLITLLFLLPVAAFAADPLPACLGVLFQYLGVPRASS
ncbi:MAG: hypothetical protein WAK20_00815 [Candidatus Acidiferrum sp.]